MSTVEIDRTLSANSQLVSSCFPRGGFKLLAMINHYLDALAAAPALLLNLLTNLAMPFFLVLGVVHGESPPAVQQVGKLALDQIRASVLSDGDRRGEAGRDPSQHFSDGVEATPGRAYHNEVMRHHCVLRYSFCSASSSS